ncbi:2Fe-2S iron-sulfur cluster-binding protein [Sansalvadorimonas sp. 2012CJ34-2]|uniref:2Fe-2S iron-sulfur cluster-binding protein n=1 Tax=Parendozoicomonas callyspongiae TaxID=2942213 RepID=A0ABT0PGI7_9GAMM|nr:2Fe-2S iron-sulfur cluster-binding protein [Sansalvadorimonas sp. 2012CJ34-2]MCL6270366.1 2Fe-2S iron-sulfur cluster-binding protein [Sansalvadorimonas sp. 2012CJ34-2]
MALIQFGEQQINNAPDETLLDTLLRKNIRVPWSCRAGLCHSCLVQATQGTIPPEAQHGLTQDQIQQRLLLACQCKPEAPLTVQMLRRELQPVHAVISKLETINPTLLELTLSPRLPVNYRPGQFITLSREKDEDGHRYTLISRPWAEPDLRIHIARRAGGDFSSWLFEEAKQGMKFWLQGLGGECCYLPERQEALILFGSGPGAGAALAVADDALWHNHRNAVQVLIHGDDSLDYQSHSVPEQNIRAVKTADFESAINDLHSNHEFSGARWVLFGKSKKVHSMTALLGEHNIPSTLVQPLAYRADTRSC